MKTIVDIPWRSNAVRANRARLLRSQHGLVLIFTLIVLVSMTLAGIALVRSVDTSTIIAGNLTARRSAEGFGNQAIEQAIGYLSAPVNALTGDSVANNYFATRTVNGMKDFTGHMSAYPGDNVNWDTLLAARSFTDSDVGGAITAMDTNGFTATGNISTWVINRLCDNPGALDPLTCSVVPVNTTSGNALGSRQVEMGYQVRMVGQGYLGQYLITVRTTGPQNTVSYIQAIVTI
jgi:Tfp pilus assembly protein PilX